jgi:3-deoxy-manno-octulosonate cytidylyltransferase (CMP-KDO synthetase)
VSFRVVIPARYHSTRLPGKPLRLIGGQPMIRRVYERACASGAGSVLIATDDERIVAACKGFGAPAVITRTDHGSGTDRLAEVASREHWPDDEIIVNVQGDEPLIDPANIAQVAALLGHRPWAALATLVTPIVDREEYLDPNVVKAVTDEAGRALYFSRAPIPWHRTHAGAGPDSDGDWPGAWRHIGLYAYRCGGLKRLSTLPAAPLERSERLEQLRALHFGLPIAVAPAAVAPGPGVDTEADLARADAAWRSLNE